MTQDSASAPDMSHLKSSKGKKKALWALLSVLIAAVSIWAVSSQMQQDSLWELGKELRRMNPIWVAAAIASMFGFIFFEGLSIRQACQAMGICPRFRHSCQYAAADIYFSAITPSATGGQPASVLLMYRDGISFAVSTAAMMINLTMCAVATFLIGAVCFLLKFSVFCSFGFLSKLLIAVGFLMQLLLALFLYLMVWHEKLLHCICIAAIKLGARLRLVRHPKERLMLLDEKMREYREAVKLVSGQRTYLLRSLFYNFMQRFAQIAVTMFMFLAMNLKGASAFDIWALQGYVVLGSNYVPIPGGMGVADLLLLDGFGSILTDSVAAQLELLSRSLSFYLCIFLCGGILLVRWALNRFARKKAEET